MGRRPVPPEAPRLDDGELVAAFVRRRAEWAFRELYRRHTPRLYQLAMRLAAWDRRDAEELVQETWIRAAARLVDFRWRSALPTWLSAIAVNVGREVARRRRARPRLVEIDAGEPWSDVYGPDESAKVDLERALASLPEGYRRVVVLHDVEGLTHCEIAGLLGIEEGTSKSQLAKARHRLRELLAPRGGKVRRIR